MGGRVVWSARTGGSRSRAWGLDLAPSLLGHVTLANAGESLKAFLLTLPVMLLAENRNKCMGQRD